jgi:hypothetical protein
METISLLATAVSGVFQMFENTEIVDSYASSTSTGHGCDVSQCELERGQYKESKKRRMKGSCIVVLFIPEIFFRRDQVRV